MENSSRTVWAKSIKQVKTFLVGGIVKTPVLGLLEFSSPPAFSLIDSRDLT